MLSSIYFQFIFNFNIPANLSEIKNVSHDLYGKFNLPKYIYINKYLF